MTPRPEAIPGDGPYVSARDYPGLSDAQAARLNADVRPEWRHSIARTVAAAPPWSERRQAEFAELIRPWLARREAARRAS